MSSCIVALSQYTSTHTTIDITQLLAVMQSAIRRNVISIGYTYHLQVILSLYLAKCCHYCRKRNTYLYISQAMYSTHLSILQELLIRSTSENMYISVHNTGEQPSRFTIKWLSSTAVVKPLAHCECMGNFSHNFVVPHQSSFLCGFQRAS